MPVTEEEHVKMIPYRHCACQDQFFDQSWCNAQYYAAYVMHGSKFQDVILETEFEGEKSQFTMKQVRRSAATSVLCTKLLYCNEQCN